MMKRRRYEICVQKYFHSFVGVVYDQVLEYARLETSKLCLGCKGVARSWMNSSQTVEESGEKSVSMVGERKWSPTALCSWRQSLDRLRR